MTWRKVAEAIGSGLPDPVKSQAAATGASPIAVENKPAPGQTGPRGLAPRTTYSRVNTGTPTVPSIGEGKSLAPQGMEFMPKVAHEEILMGSMMTRPTMQDLVKEAMVGTLSKVNISAEAARAFGHAPAQVKTAAPTVPSIVPTVVIEKTAAALEYLAKKANEVSAGVGPGVGPGALQVLQATSSEDNIDAGQQGQATAGNILPQNPPMQAFSDSNSAANAMATNIDMEHGEQPVDPMNNETASNEGLKAASMKLAQRNLMVLRKLALDKRAFSVTDAGHKYDASSARAEQQAAEARMLASRDYEDANPILSQFTGIGTGLTGFPDRMRARHQSYVAGQHEDGRNAWNPFGGALTPTPAEGKLRRTAAAQPEDPAAAQATAPKQASAKKGPSRKTASLQARNLAVLGLRKQAEDAINPAQISAGAASAEGAEAPSGVSPSEEGPIPPVPSDVSGQQRFVGDNMAAINYTRRDAKADPKRDLSQLLSEPALSAATDKTLSEAFDHTSESGAKISSARLVKTAAAHALLLKLAEEHESDKRAGALMPGPGKKPKEKNSNAGLSTPSGQSGFSASGMGGQGM